MPSVGSTFGVSVMHDRFLRAARTLLLLVVGATSGCRCGKDDRAPSVGRFEPAMPEVVLLADGRKATLLKPFAYVETVPGDPPTERRWDVPKDATVDGASIPRLFWTLVSGPWEGEYRYASIVHDRYCDRPAGRTWRQTHRMFFDACVTGGTPLWKAKLMYAAVFHFGPTWRDGAAVNDGDAGDAAADPSAPPMLRAGTGENARRRDEARRIFAAERPLVIAAAEPAMPPGVGAGPATSRPTTLVDAERAWRRAVLSPRLRRSSTTLPTNGLTAGGRRDALEVWEEIKQKVAADENVPLETLEAIRDEP